MSPERVPLADEIPLTPELQQEIDDYFFADGGWTGPIGSLLSVLLTTALAWPLLDRQNLILWTMGGLAVTVVLTVVSVIPRFRKPADRYGSPWPVNVIAGAFGANMGAIMLVDLEALAVAETRLTLLAILLAVSAASAAGRAALGGQGRWMHYFVWLVGGTALLFASQWILAAAATTFLVFLARDRQSTSTVVFEILALRQMYRIQAEVAAAAAVHDSLTGLLNRAGLDYEVQQLKSESITAMFVDLDHFKEVNDRFGHAAGDAVLVEVGQRVSSMLRLDDVLARVGGDEFFLLFTKPIPRSRQLQLAEDIIAALEEPFVIGNDEALISASVGITSSLRGSPIDLETLQHDADQALYAAKRRGRRQAAFFDRQASASQRHVS